MARIHFDRVSKSFPHASGRSLLRTHILNWFDGRHTEQFHALKNVSFSIEDGESVGVIGSNGAGKSTLLSLIAGLATPTSGTVEVTGRIAALMELGSGFHADLTGAENLLLNASLLGMTRRETLDKFERIVEFSGIADFISEPLRTYSAGMTVRLAFAIAVHTESDLMIIDEVLAVGDANFQVKCADALREMRRAGKTLLFVSHNSAAVLDMCDRALWLDHGQLVMDGLAAPVVEAYEGAAVAPREG